MCYPFVSIDERFYGAKTKTHIPIISILRKRYAHSKKCREFLKRTAPAKLITASIKFPCDTIVKEANALGIETIFLQWVFPANHYIFPHYTPKRQRGTSLAVSPYSFFLLLSCAVLDFRFKESRYAQTWAVPKKIVVFNEMYKKLKSKDFDPQTIHIAPTIDFQFVHELKQKIRSDSIFRDNLLAKYGLNKNKVKIVVVLFRFYALKLKDTSGKTFMTNEEHVAHYYNVCKLIRRIFPVHEADILLKMHPSERNLYESYKGLGVTLYHDESQTDELICLSDLYISDPTTNVNNMAIASGIPAIFINLSPFRMLENCMHFYGIKHTVIGEQEFLSMLQQFKDGILEKQYDNSHVDINSVDTLINVIEK